MTLPQVQACAIRVSKLDGSGVPQPGANNLYVSNALITLTADPVIAEGEEFEVKNACGEVCVSYRDCDRLKRLNIALEICTPDPELHLLLAGGKLLQNGAGVGWAAPALNDADCPNGVSIELWAKNVDSSGGLDPDFPYAWWALPRTYLQMGARTFANQPVNSQFGGFAIENPNWYDGPANDWPDDSDRVIQWVPTTVLPALTDGAVTLAAS